MIDPKDLQQITMADFAKQGVGGVFYRKEEDGSFSMCLIYPEELKNPERAYDLRQATKSFIEKGLLFNRINRPWEAFE